MDYSGLIGVILTIFSGFIGILVWVMRKMIEIGRMMGTVEWLVSEVKKQVTNNHNTNLRDDLTELSTSIKYVQRDTEVIHKKLDRHIEACNYERKYNAK